MDIGARCQQCKGLAVRCDLCHGTGRNDAQPPVMRPEYLDLPPGVSPDAFAAESAAREYADNHMSGETTMALFDDEPWIITEEGEDEFGDPLWVATLDGCPLTGTGQTEQAAISNLRSLRAAASIAAREARDDFGDWRRDQQIDRAA